MKLSFAAAFMFVAVTISTASSSDVDILSMTDLFGADSRALLDLELIGDGSQYECNSPFVQAFGDETMQSFDNSALPFYFELVHKWKLIRLLERKTTFGVTESDEPEAFGSIPKGQKYLKILKDLKAFWDVPTDHVIVRSFNAAVLLDPVALKDAYKNAFLKWTDAKCEEAANRVHEIVTMYPDLGPSFPFWTFNVFAWKPSTIRPGAGIAIGEGFLSFLEWMNVDETAPFYLMAHEFAHNLQFVTQSEAMGNKTPEVSRYFEMQADALAAYYLHHPRGASLQSWRINQVVEAAYAFGDCNFERNNHHGTPTQRLESSEFGILKVDAIRGKGDIMPYQEFIDDFQAAFDTLT